MSGLRETVGWLLEPAFLQISIKVASSRVLKVGDNRGCTGIEPRFRGNEVGPGRGAEQRSNNIHQVVQDLDRPKISSSQKNVVIILNFQIIFGPAQA